MVAVSLASAPNITHQRWWRHKYHQGLKKGLDAICAHEGREDGEDVTRKMLEVRSRRNGRHLQCEEDG